MTVVEYKKTVGSKISGAIAPGVDNIIQHLFLRKSFVSRIIMFSVMQMYYLIRKELKAADAVEKLGYIQFCCNF